MPRSYYLTVSIQISNFWFTRSEEEQYLKIDSLEIRELCNAHYHLIRTICVKHKTWCGNVFTNTCNSYTQYNRSQGRSNFDTINLNYTRYTKWGAQVTFSGVYIFVPLVIQVKHT